MTDQIEKAETVAIVRHADGTPMASRDSDGVVWLPTMEPVMHHKVGGEMFGARWESMHISHLALFMNKMRRYVQDDAARVTKDDGEKARVARMMYDEAHSGNPTQSKVRATKATIDPITARALELFKTHIKGVEEIAGRKTIAAMSDSPEFGWVFDKGTWNHDAMIKYINEDRDLMELSRAFLMEAKEAIEFEEKQKAALADKIAALKAAKESAGK